MCKTAFSSGGAGDIVYAIPIMRRLGVETLYVEEAEYPNRLTLFETVAPLIESQGIRCMPKSSMPGPADYNLDHFRNQPHRGTNHIIKSYCQEFKLSTDGWNKPFLKVSAPNLYLEKYSLIHLTSRWRGDRNLDWKKIRMSIPHRVFFIGFKEEWADFCNRHTYIPFWWHRPANLLDMAGAITNAESLYCNQSVGVTIAQGLGKEYFLEKKPGKTNTLFYTPNEHLL